MNRIRQMTGRILAATVLGCFMLQGGYARAFNSEEHKVLVDLAVSEVIQPDAVQLPWPTHFEDSPIGVLKAAYDNAKILAVGYADNNPTWRSYCLNAEIDPETKPQGYSQYALGVQDNSYFEDDEYTVFNQIEGNLNIWIPPASMVRERNLSVAGYLDDDVQTFTFGDLVAIYGDYRRTTYCQGGNCYLSNESLSTIGFYRGWNCYWVGLQYICGFRPAPLQSDRYLKRLAAGLWPPHGCLGNAIQNTAWEWEWWDAGWWGDEMMRIANANDWHFASAAVAWYIGMHRLALHYVELARDDPAYWNAALHYEANGLHSLTDLFCYGHIVTNRGRTATLIIQDHFLTGHPANLWMGNVLLMGGAERLSDGRIDLIETLPTVSVQPNNRDDLMRTYQGTRFLLSIQETLYHRQFNASGAVVRNLKGHTFNIMGDGEVRNMSPEDLDMTVQAVRTSLQSLFDAYTRLENGETEAEIASEGSSYFEALEWIPIFVESDSLNIFPGRWTRYAGHVDAVTGSNIVPDLDWVDCQMAYIDGDESLPVPNADPCTSFPGIGTAVPLATLTSLAQNYPNPFNPVTTIAFELAEATAVSLTVIDISGRLVRTLVAGEILDSGPHSTSWNGRNQKNQVVAAGVYFYRFEAGNFSETRQMALLK